MSNTPQGLTAEEVRQRTDAGMVNVDASIKTRTYQQIFRENLCTLFNFVNLVLAVIVFFTGSYKNMLFMGVIICNVCIGIIQEIRSKRTTDKLSIITASSVGAMRDGQRVQIPCDQIVLGDVIILGRGNQVPADCTVLQGTCDCNESLLTGESDLIPKTAGSTLMSGSFVNSGVVYARVDAVGAESYAARISAEAKEHKRAQSEIMDTLNSIVKMVSIALPFVGTALFCSTYFRGGGTVVECTLSTVAAMIGMIPEGLILLTSTVLAVAVIRLAKSQVLVQQLYCIETLARVDTLCLDKTGTITTGEMEVSQVRPLDSARTQEADSVLACIARSDDDPNETSRAILARYAQWEGDVPEAARLVPFSSDRKYSGVVLSDGRSYCLGATQFVLGAQEYTRVASLVDQLSASARVLVLAQVEGFDQRNNLTGTAQPVAFVCIHDQIRKTAAQTIQFFKDQGVTVNVISGDDPRTVSGIAAKVFSRLAAANVSVDMIIQNVSEDGVTDISFTCPKSDLPRASETITSILPEINAREFVVDEDIAKVSVVGTGMKSSPGVAAKMFSTLGENEINILAISTSPIRLSVVVRSSQAVAAVQCLHTAFNMDSDSVFVETQLSAEEIAAKMAKGR